MTLKAMTNYKKLGVIGGVGPAATALFFQRVVEYTNVACDQEHLDITILNRPSIPDRTDYLLAREGAASFVPSMNQAARELEAAGCDVLSTPCNTAHAKLNAIARGLTRAQFVNMLDKTAQVVKRLGVTNCAVLATDGTLATQVYKEALAEQGIGACTPNSAGQELVMSVIYDQVKAGKPLEVNAFFGLCEQLAEQGCDGIILGCTELSLVPLPAYVHGAAIVDALDVLAWACVRSCGAPAKDFFAQYEPSVQQPSVQQPSAQQKVK